MPAARCSTRTRRTSRSTCNPTCAAWPMWSRRSARWSESNLSLRTRSAIHGSGVKPGMTAWGFAMSFVLRFCLAVFAAWACASAAFAQTYPTRPVRIVVPFAAGGPADNYARFLALRLQESLGQAFVIDDKPGGGSVIGTDLVAKAPADGYTLLLM